MALPGLLSHLSQCSSLRCVRPVLALLALGFPLFALVGCGDQGFRTTSRSASQAISGNVHGGQQPISGATIQLYAPGNTGDGSSATPLFSAPVLTDSSGSFTFGTFNCPSPTIDVYLTATGGNPGLQSGVTNSHIALMSAIGQCGSITTSTWFSVNELTTVAAVYSLAPFMQSYSAVGSAQLDSQLMTDSFAIAQEMVNTGTGATPGTGIPAGQTVPAQKLSALANILATCINSAGGNAGDGSVCGTLFSLATPLSRTPPEDTVQALLNIANNPTNQVLPIYLLSPSIAPFEPTLVSPPSDWTLSMNSSIPAPTLSPTPGTYASSPWVTLSDSNAAAQIYYTIDGSTPTASSTLFTGALSLSATGMIRAVAIAGGVNSQPVAGLYTIQQPAILLSPSRVSLAASQTQAYTATVVGASNPAVMWSLNPSVGSISAAGVYTAPAALASTQTVTVTATSAADSAVTASSTVSLVPPANATHLNFVTQPSATIAGSPISPFVAVAIEDVNGNVVTDSSAVVTLALAGSASAATAGTLTATAVNGVAQFNNVAVLLPGTGYQLAASSPGLAAASSAVFSVSAVTSPLTLRQAGARHGVLMGAAADADEFGEPNPLVIDPQYAATLGAQYSLLEPENAMKWMVVGAQQGTYNFEPGDTLVAFAQANQMEVRGHNLCWYANNPTWLSGLSSSTLSQTLQAYIAAVMGHYKGKVFAWDVVNEAISDSASTTGTTLRDSIWYDTPGIGVGGTGYIEQAFRWARAADPNALLFYNDYGIETSGNKSQALLNMLTDFKSRGVPIDGIGLEMHVDTSTYFPSTFPAVLKAYTDLGLQVHITELDVRLSVDANGNASAADLQAQAQTYQFVVSTCLTNPLCTAIDTWGFTDKYSWIPGAFSGLGAALPFDANYAQKPAYGAMMNALK